MGWALCKACRRAGLSQSRRWCWERVWAQGLWALTAPFCAARRGWLCSTARRALLLALGFAFALHALVGEPVAAVFLAFAPGGLAEMSLIALSLNLSAIYVTAHHVARIVLAVTAAKIGSRWLR